MPEQGTTPGVPSYRPSIESPAHAPVGSPRAAGGLLVRRMGWRLSGGGRLLFLAISICGVCLTLCYIHPFLAVTNRTPSDLLVVEGWLPSFALKRAIVEFEQGGYRHVLTSGGPTHEDSGTPAGSSYAAWGADRLSKRGLPIELITPVPSTVEQKDRTYYSAVAVREWLAESGKSVTSLNVVSLGPHSRRTRLLFQKALGPKVKVGIIAVPDSYYDSAHWWRSSEGVWEVVGETIAYAYARTLFHPSDADSQSQPPGEVQKLLHK